MLLRIRLLGALAALAAAFALLLAPITAAAVPGRASPPAADGGLATIVAVRAAHHSGFDRFVLEFDRARAPRPSVSYVGTLLGDGSGLPVPVPGRATLRVVVRNAQAHNSAGQPTVSLDRAFALPNVMSLRNAGDFEGVVTMGIGLARRMPYKVRTYTNPGRIAIDVSTSFARTTRTVYFANQQGARVAVRRPVPDAYPAKGLLDRIFAGPTPGEAARGIRLVASGATGFTSVSVASGVARLQLTGGCKASGNATIADSIIPTLRRLRTVDWVKIYYPAGQTLYPTGPRDSVPACLAGATSQCLYFVKDIFDAGDIYGGSFLVLRRTGTSVAGTTGEFYSEWFPVRGTLTDSAASIERQVESGAWVPMNLTWLPAKGTFSGWDAVSAATMRKYSGGGVPVTGQPCGE